MKKLKQFSIIFILLTSSIFFNSCSTESCEGVTCEFDGECEDGDCICTVLTENFIIGEWDIESTGGAVGTFNADNTFIDSFGNVVTWELHASTRQITLSTGNILNVSENGFSCQQINVTVDNGTSTNDLVLIRK